VASNVSAGYGTALCTPGAVAHGFAAANNKPLHEDEQLFDSERHCLFCGVDIYNSKNIAHLSNQEVINRFINFCACNTDTFITGVKRRLSSVNLDESRPPYHKRCFKKFDRLSRKSNTSSLSMMSVESHTTNNSSLAMSLGSCPEQLMGDVDCSDIFNDNVFVEHSVQPSSSGQENVCSSCRRFETNELKVSMVPGPLIKRQYSLMPRNTVGEHLLCELCALYLTQKLPTTKMWQCAWPSVLACLLTRDMFQSIRNELWSLLPNNFKKAWNHLYLPVDEDIVCKHSCFEDVTDKRTRFYSYVESGEISDFVKAMHEYSFPSVKCPAGCFAYVDECTTVAFNDFLAWHFDISIFDGSKTHLEGARRDWPCASTQLHNFNVCPSVVQDSQYGLCVLMCKSHGKRLDKSFLHVPLNPLVENIGFQCVDSLCCRSVNTECHSRWSHGKVDE
jgi:hypothetical protein